MCIQNFKIAHSDGRLWCKLHWSGFMNAYGQPFVSCRLVNWLAKCECTEHHTRAAQSPLFHVQHWRDPLAPGNRAANFEPASVASFAAGQGAVHPT